MRNKSQSQSSQSRNGTQASQSQLSQSQIQTQPLTIENEDKLIQNCVRYFLYRAGTGLPIRKSDIQKQVLKNVGKNYSSIFNKAKAVLKEVYGYDVYECEDGQTVVRYLISNSLTYKNSSDLNNTTNQSLNDDDLEIPEDVYKILVMLVLTHIFMSDNSVTQNVLFAFLQSVDIDPEVNHEIFGNVKTFITNTMVHQKYLVAENDEITRQTTYKWGPRAEHEISKHGLLKFVCKIYKDRAPKSWQNQFEVANAQFGESGAEQNGIESMDVADD
ncbi:hypothetical protein RN001_013432 [Aquatica leii]|uniref:MAGE domain-containing protein n=1 Tax=Aquatica leii TaxID=1421715 RepID=A0AAN7PRR7_9COLE|nr:hypothetical protein RN001_013432 [Aquatica leii]